MRLEDQVARLIAERVAQAEVSRPDADSVVRRGRSRRRRRRAWRSGVAAALVVAAVVATVVVRDGDGAGVRLGPQDIRPVGALDYGDGLRAVASPDGGVSMGGRSFEPGDVPDLDTAATATPYGMVFFDSAGHARLLARTGDFVDLGGPAAPAPADYRPSARSDAALPLVAFTLPRDGGVTVVLQDLATTQRVAELDLDCGGCRGVRVDAVDRGLVFVRTGDETVVWDHAATGRATTRVGSGDFRLADARGGRLLWSGAPPSPEPGSPVAGWPTTEGPVDSTLSHDGRHVLGWSNVLEPTTAGGSAIWLDVRAVFYAFDTDGSVLAATLGGAESTVYDCELPSGRCEQVGTVSTTSGDPIFLGADM